jgi:hypothetical protein
VINWGDEPLLARDKRLSLKPIIFVLGLSGVGKDYTSGVLKEEFSFLRKDMDQNPKHVFEYADFPAEWDKNLSLVDFGILAAGIRAELADNYRGAVLSFPTTYRFDRAQLEVASSHGVAVVLLWGEFGLCMEVRRKRQLKNKGTRLNKADYLRKNKLTFDMYKSSEYDAFRVGIFEQDGSRPSRETLLSRMTKQLSNQGVELNQ